MLNLKAAKESLVIPAATKARKTTTTKPNSNTKLNESGIAPGKRAAGPTSEAKKAAETPRRSAAEQSLSMAAGATPLRPAIPSQVAVAASAATSAPASLNIDSTPRGADIEIDGAFVGNTPSTVSIAPGSHQIAARMKGFSSWTRSLNVTGGSIHLNAELEKESPKQ